MKKIFATFFTILGFYTSFSQSNWTQDSRQSIYSSCLLEVTDYELTDSQKESICLCMLNDYTSKYTKEEISVKIDIEIKRITEAIITQCAKNIGIDLRKNKEIKDNKVLENKTDAKYVNDKKTDITYTRSFLYGSWECEKKANGNTQKFTFSETDCKEEQTFKAAAYLNVYEWFIDFEAGRLTLLGKRNQFYKIINISNNEITLQFIYYTSLTGSTKKQEGEILKFTKN